MVTFGQVTLAHDSSQSSLVQQTDEQHLSTAYVAEMYSSAAQVVFDVHCVVEHSTLPGAVQQHDEHWPVDQTSP